ncbi:MAG: D-alanyl-D-alanine carboxypeptidase/D-alanyl-D-alanine-endopeptidase, partial [Verrucomicrobia bacterium]
GGIDGTLASRFPAGPARGNVRAKTGSLRHVQSLAGYVATAGGQPLVFAVCINGFQSEAAGASARAEIDRLVEALAAFPGRGPE